MNKNLVFPLRVGRIEVPVELIETIGSRMGAAISKFNGINRGSRAGFIILNRIAYGAVKGTHYHNEAQAYTHPLPTDVFLGARIVCDPFQDELIRVLGNVEHELYRPSEGNEVHELNSRET